MDIELLDQIWKKVFKWGGVVIRNLGYKLKSLAIVEKMDEGKGTVYFRKQ
jgi:hypothetical protein